MDRYSGVYRSLKLQLGVELDKTLQMKTNKYHDNTCKAMFSVIHKNHLIKSPTYNCLVCLFCKDNTFVFGYFSDKGYILLFGFGYAKCNHL